MFLTQREFVLLKKEKTGVKKLEGTMVELGYPINYGKIRAMDFYPLWLSILHLLVIKQLFDLDDEGIQALGRTAAKISILIRLFMRYFFSLDAFAKQVPKMWRRFFDVGELEVYQYDAKKKYAILRLKNFQGHPVYCQDFIGYFAGILEMVVRTKVNGTETKCIFHNDDYHEFVLKW